MNTIKKGVVLLTTLFALTGMLISCNQDVSPGLSFDSETGALREATLGICSKSEHEDGVSHNWTNINGGVIDYRCTWCGDEISFKED